MWRADVPVARICEVIEGNAARERRGCEVVRVSTIVEVSRSIVRMEWSSEAE
jgi:hypothetical protein